MLASLFSGAQFFERRLIILYQPMQLQFCEVLLDCLTLKILDLLIVWQNGFNNGWFITHSFWFLSSFSSPTFQWLKAITYLQVYILCYGAYHSILHRFILTINIVLTVKKLKFYKYQISLLFYLKLSPYVFYNIW